MMELHRLRCGIIYSREFAEYLCRKGTEESQDHPGELMSLEYVRCVDGEHAGSAWLRLGWTPILAVPLEQRIQIGSTEVFVNRQSRRGLKDRLIHFTEGRVIVKQ